MFYVCDSNLKICGCGYGFLSEAKTTAKNLSAWYRKLYFVCDAGGNIIAGY